MKTLTLSYWDGIPLIVYLILLFYIGYRAYRRTDVRDENDFLLGNRSLTLPAFVATLVTTWYGGILGIGEFTYSHGISTWIVLGLPYYIFAALFAFLIAGKVRAAGQFTIADIFYNRHGRSVGILGSIFLLFMTTPAPYILMIALLLQIIFSWSFIFSLIVGTAVSTLYVFFGGFRSVVQTDKFQFILIYAGFIIFLCVLWINLGGFSFLKQELDPIHLSWIGENSIQYIIVWFFLASWTFIDPGFHQRCSAAKTLQTARKGILISILFWFIFDILTITTGLYAAASLTGINPLLSYPLLADKFLPPFLKGLFLTGLLAVIMSTIDSFTLLSAITFGRDLVWRITKNNSRTISDLTRIGLILTAIISIGLCVLFPSVIKLWYVIGSLFIPPMLMPVLTAYFPKYKLPIRMTFIVMIASFTLSLFSFIWGQIYQIGNTPSYPFNLEPFFPGFFLSIILYLVLYLTTKITK
ncbi:MAG: sodium:solute symporter family protein [Calditrichia bacterium]|nr:sodium:solute symporter family protein [Calditrichia bacterium]